MEEIKRLSMIKAFLLKARGHKVSIDDMIGMIDAKMSYIAKHGAN